MERLISNMQSNNNGGAAAFLAMAAFLMALKQYFSPSDFSSGGIVFGLFGAIQKTGGGLGVPLFFSGVGILAGLIWIIDKTKN